MGFKCKKGFQLSRRSPWVFQFCCAFLGLTTTALSAQTLGGNLTRHKQTPIQLLGFKGLDTYVIAQDTTDEMGGFSFLFKKEDYGMAQIIVPNENPFLVILSNEEVLLEGPSLQDPAHIHIQKGAENKAFEHFAKEQAIRDNARSAWDFLETLYAQNGAILKKPSVLRDIKKEQKRIQNQEDAFFANLPKQSMLHRYIPLRNMLNTLPITAQKGRTQINKAIAYLRKLDYTDTFFLKSGLMQKSIEGHFWLIENAGLTLDSSYLQMQISIDSLLDNLKNQTELRQSISEGLFDLLERHSLFQASEYLALKLLNGETCEAETPLAYKLEAYRKMKIGNIAPEINLGYRAFRQGRLLKSLNALDSLKATHYLLVFGASWCSHCEAMLPELARKYADWSQMGLELVYVSLDDSLQAFYAQTATYPFICYSDFKKWASPIVKSFHVFATPTFYILDAQRKIKVKPISLSQIESWVNHNLKTEETKTPGFRK